jgi:hypothetical protein
MSTIRLHNKANSTSIVLDIDKNKAFSNEIVKAMNCLSTRIYLYENYHTLLPSVRTEEQALDLINSLDLSIEFNEKLPGLI